MVWMWQSDYLLKYSVFMIFMSWTLKINLLLYLDLSEEIFKQGKQHKKDQQNNFMLRIRKVLSVYTMSS
jgi:hypothetical protein